MAYTNPGFVNGQAPYLNATNINNLANEVQSMSTTLQKVPINKGGTNATTASAARTNLGLDTAGINALVAGNPLPVANGGTGVTNIINMKRALGLPYAGMPFYDLCASQYLELVQKSSSETIPVSSISIPSCIYVGDQGGNDKMLLSGLPGPVYSANLYIITFFSPHNDTTMGTRRIQFVIPETSRDIYMNITHGSTDTGWGKLSFTAV